MYRLGKIQQKILLLFLSGAALATSPSSRISYQTLKATRKEWLKVDQRSFNRSIRALSKEKLICERRLTDGSMALDLTKAGKREARRHMILGRTIRFKKPKKWDRKWRIVSFDIPEEHKDFRNILRLHLYALDFHRLQLSMFVTPYPHEKELQELVELYAAGPYVRIMTVQWIDNQAALEKIFFGRTKT